MKFRTVDKIIFWEPKSRIHIVKAVSFEEYCLKSPFGDCAGLPESLVLESIFQSANWLTILSSDFKQVVFPESLETVEFRDPLLPGERLFIETHFREFSNEGIRFDGVGKSGKQEIVIFKNCTSKIFPLAEFLDPEDMRTLFSEIFSPREKIPYEQF